MEQFSDFIVAALRTQVAIDDLADAGIFKLCQDKRLAIDEPSNRARIHKNLRNGIIACLDRLHHLSPSETGWSVPCQRGLTLSPLLSARD